MSENNKSFRLKCNKKEDEHIKINLTQDFDLLNILTLKITQEDAYKLYSSNYGVLVGRVLANEGFGIPNAKISIFIPSEDKDLTKENNILYPYSATNSLNSDGIRYNLLPENKEQICYQNIGSFPSKKDILDNDTIIQVYDAYYKYTTTTNESGDYMFFGIPTGSQQIHVDIDLSDIGLLSQTPRDMVYKGYSLKSFDSPNKFKKSTNLDSLPQIISQDTTVFVYPFWGDEAQAEIGITKKNINIQYKFEPTCVFMGSVFTDSPKSGLSKNCKPTKDSGKMSDLMTSQGLIEMIRKTQAGGIERYDVNGGRVIDNNGVWCYQIPMNLDYMITDEYGNLVPTDNPTIGIPTRAEVRFRVTMDDTGGVYSQTKTGSYLIPNNPKEVLNEDYEFNENCKEGSFVNLFWNKVYTVKNYIPRLQTSSFSKKRNFLGLKGTNYHNSNNPAPYNKIFIDLNLKFKLLCLISKFYIELVAWINVWFIGLLNYYLISDRKHLPYILIDAEFLGDCDFLGVSQRGKDLTLAEYFVPFSKTDANKFIQYEYFGVTLLGAYNKKNNQQRDMKENSVDNTDDGFLTVDGGVLGWGQPGNRDVKVCFGATTRTNYSYAEFYTLNKDLVSDIMDCIETNLSASSEVVNFDFNNDWLNGSLYLPRFFTKTRINRKTGKRQIKFCGSKQNYPNLKILNSCAPSINVNNQTPSLISGKNNKCIDGNCYDENNYINTNYGNITYDNSNDIFYYKSNLFLTNTVYYHPTDIILIGGLSENDNDGIPKLHQLLPSTSFKMVDDAVEIDGNVKVYSGVDWGNNNANINDGLFVSVGCLDSITVIKSCVNAERLCEIGVDFDENYDFTDYNGTTVVTKNVDGFISLDELSEGDSRGMFATLNKNGLKTIYNNYGLKRYDFVYNYPTGFDGKLSVNLAYSIGTGDNKITSNYLQTDIKNKEYNKFRFGNENGGSYVYDLEHKIPRYENSFYFYFGLKQGSTALDLFNSQYYVPCVDPKKDDFILKLSIISGETICPSSDGKINILLEKNVFPYDIYLDGELYSENNNEPSVEISNLFSGYHKITVIDGNKNEVSKTIFVPKNGLIDFDVNIINCGVIDSNDGKIILSNFINIINNKKYDLYRNNILIETNDNISDNVVIIDNLNSGDYTLVVYEEDCLVNKKTININIRYNYMIQFIDFIEQQVTTTYMYETNFINYVPQQVEI